ncbi:hypothetical protein AGMMS50276_28620 [Synergistales bacterium]|nr:hypothetical protein AGMMS50276_28620 [Synergistales bacterium]
MEIYPPDFVAYFVMHENDSYYEAAYKISRHNQFHIVLVVDDYGKLVGIITKNELRGYPKTAGEACNRKFPFIYKQQDRYAIAAKMFAEDIFDDIPIVDDDMHPVDILSRFQVFIRHATFGNYVACDRPHYAKLVGAAVWEAKNKGYDSISVIEFGVAGGAGLRLMEFYAIEFERLYGVKVDVYGFDSGEGLFEPIGYRNAPQSWSTGWFQFDIDKVQRTLRRAKLVVGDICQTSKSFLTDDIAPIGAIAVDVDTYDPTVAILDMLLGADKYFLPLVYMYFDDIMADLEFQCETLAIKDFNAKQNLMKISPEGWNLSPHGCWTSSSALTDNPYICSDDSEEMKLMKTLVRFNHSRISLK